MKIKLICLVALVMLVAVGKAQHFIGEPKPAIITHFAYDHSVKSMKMGREMSFGIDVEVLSYRFVDRTQYYYINPANNYCESFAALYDSPTAKDSLIAIYDKRYKRIEYPYDKEAIAWIEYEDGINYRRVLRDFHPPTCLVILALDKKVED